MRRLALLPAFAVLALAATGSAYAAATPSTPAPVASSNNPASTPVTEFSLSADGEVSVAPDIAVIQMGVTTSGRSAAYALKDNREKMLQVIAVLKGLDVQARDIQTTGISLNPQYVYEQNLPPRLTGYQASNSVTVTVRDIANAGPVMDAVTVSNANQINGISFDISDRQKAEDEARRAAVRALQAKAALYADATGLHIQRLESLSEGGAFVARPQPMMVRAMAKSAEAMSTPVEPGEMKVRISITGVFELTR